MILTRWRLGASGALVVACALQPAAAQLSSPLPPGAQGTGATTSAAQPSVAVPPATPAAPFQPAVLPTTPDADMAVDPGVAATPARIRASDTLALEPRPSEFEAYVSSVAGKPLRRFGAELLIPEARDFTTPPTATVPDDYRINPGDELQLDLAGSVQAALRLRVDRAGRIFVPRVGAITVAGTRFGDLRERVARVVERQYRGFQLNVTVARLRGLTVYVTGFARRPGAYTVGSLSTLVNAVLAAGGPSAGGSFRSIRLKRGGKLVSDFDLYDLLLKGDKGGDAVLQDGDVIHIAPAGPEVAVIGSVNREALFELAPGETVGSALLYAGGVSTAADDTRLLLFHALGGNGGWQQVSAREAGARSASRGDIVRVLSDVGIARPLGQQPVLVTLGGEVTKPGRYYVAPGTRLADVVMRAGGLTRDAYPYASVITRESVKAQQRESFDRAVKDMELLLSTQPLVSANRAKAANPTNLALIDSVVGQMRRREPTGRLVFDLPSDAPSLPADLVVENNDTIYVPSRPVTVGVFGAVASPASFAYRSGQTIGDFVKSAGGIQHLGDRKEVFVVRANGTVLTRGRGTLKAPALPGDLVYVPVDADRGEFWARLRDITGSLFGVAIGAASINGLSN